MSLIDDAIEALKAKNIAEPRIVPPPTREQIAAAEAALQIKFPPTFLAFLARCGSYLLPYWETYWVGDKSLGYRNIVKANFSEREEVDSALPPFLVSFQNNGCGDQLCFDTRNRRADGEYPIVFWDHELTPHENLGRLSPLFDTFAEWLMDEANEATRF